MTRKVTLKSNPLVLSLFPGIDLLGRAFEEEGFCVVRGPDVIFGSDIRTFHPPAGKFDGVIGGPPCQCFSRLAHMIRQNGYEPKFGNLIPEFERCVEEAQPDWFLMENVPDAPAPSVSGYGCNPVLINNRDFGEDVNRVRRISFGFRGAAVNLPLAFKEHSENFEYAACGGSARGESGRTPPKGKTFLPFNTKSRAAFAELKRKQGLPAEFDLPGWTVEGKCKAVGNGVPMATGRAIAKAIGRLLTDFSCK